MSMELTNRITAAVFICTISICFGQEKNSTSPTSIELKDHGKSTQSGSIAYVPTRNGLPDRILAFGARKGGEMEMILAISNDGNEPVQISRDKGFSLLSAGQTFVGKVEDLEGDQKPPLPEFITLGAGQIARFEVSFPLNNAELAEKWTVRANFTINGSQKQISSEISSDQVLVRAR